MVKTMLVKQLLMGTLFHDLAILDHQQLVCIPDCAQTVGYDKAGAAFHQLIQRGLYLCLILHVHRTVAVIQNQYGIIGKQSMCNGNPLHLTTGEIHSALLHMGVVPIWNIHYELMSMGSLYRCKNLLFRCLQTTIANVIPPLS
jgi:hypothetical protein